MAEESCVARCGENAAAAFAPGTVLLGKYRVEKVLGIGGMGVVLAVLHTELEELFAMKVMKPSLLEVRGATHRFLQEARAAAKLRSPHVAHVYDFGHLEDGTPYMVMEHLVGNDLRMTLAREGPLDAARVVDYLLQALDAIVEAHSSGIVHRDLKPDNLFLTKSVGPPTIKVLDFGISKNMLGDEDVVMSSGVDSGTKRSEEGVGVRTSGIIGSPYYMSPEQILTSSNVDTRADIWSLGVIAYELLTDEVPFHGRTNLEVCCSVVEGRAIRLQSIAPGLPDGLLRIIDRCLEPAPDDRFPSATDLAEALQQVAIELREKPVIRLESMVRTLPPTPDVGAQSTELAPLQLFQKRTSAKRFGAFGGIAFAMVSIAATALVLPPHVAGAGAIASAPLYPSAVVPTPVAAAASPPAQASEWTPPSDAPPGVTKRRPDDTAARGARPTVPASSHSGSRGATTGVATSRERHSYEGVY